MTFHALHQQESPLVLANIWDVPSAQAVQKLPFQAMGTSSAAVAASMGYADGEAFPFEQLEERVRQITNSSTLPLSVDIEGGYSRDPDEIAEHILRLAELGVVGINLEDSVVSAQRELLEASTFAKTIERVREQLSAQGAVPFLNIRTDTYLLRLADAAPETQRRIRLYEEAGADGIFIPCITQPADIEAAVAATSLPINVMCMPDLPNFATLQQLGVKRISMGNFLFEKMYESLAQLSQSLLSSGSFELVFA
ncbi:MAG: isocitrate lyase/phosphoenolpyruvate mutase family protein [Bacteroidota bacterium]